MTGIVMPGKSDCCGGALARSPVCGLLGPGASNPNGLAGCAYNCSAPCTENDGACGGESVKGLPSSQHQREEEREREGGEEGEETQRDKSHPSK